MYLFGRPELSLKRELHLPAAAPPPTHTHKASSLYVGGRGRGGQELAERGWVENCQSEVIEYDKSIKSWKYKGKTED